MKKASLVVAGFGIKFMSHLTMEVKAYIQASDALFYLVNEPAMEKWMQMNFPHSTSLDVFYTKHFFRLHAYQAMTNYILEALYKNQHVCVVFYGHPIVFAKPALDAVILAKEKGYDVKVLPGISAEDCLFADLLINPGSRGCQSYEATDFLVYKRKFDTRSHLILWQVGMIGSLSYPKLHNNSIGSIILMNYLKQEYDESHSVTLYEAAQYPHFKPRIDEIHLSELPECRFSHLSTLYIPPAKPSICDESMLRALNIIGPNLNTSS